MADEITYMLLESDYVLAQRTHFARSIRSWPVLRRWFFFVIAGAVVGTLASFGETTSRAKILVIAWFTASGVIFTPLCWILSFLLLPRQARRLYRQQRAFSLPWTYRWTESGIENEGATGTSRYAWNELHAWARSDRIFLFYVNDILFLLLPTRVLSQAQADDLEALLREHGPTRR